MLVFANFSPNEYKRADTFLRQIRLFNRLRQSISSRRGRRYRVKSGTPPVRQWLVKYPHTFQCYNQCLWRLNGFCSTLFQHWASKGFSPWFLTLFHAYASIQFWCSNLWFLTRFSLYRQGLPSHPLSNWTPRGQFRGVERPPSSSRAQRVIIPT